MAQDTMTTYSDVDWAGCKNTRKSTTGGVIKIGSHCVKGWSKTQALIAFSSGESEFYVALRASVETLGLLSMCKDLGWKLHGEVWGDANAALGIINRTGLGKTRHIQTGLLWIQQVSADQRLKFGKVLGTDNPADLFTKYFDEKTCIHHTRNLGYNVAQGRPEDAPQLHSISMSMDEYYIGKNIRPWPGLQYLERRKTNGVHYEARQGKGGELNVVHRTKHTKQNTKERQITQDNPNVVNKRRSTRSLYLETYVDEHKHSTCSRQRVLWGSRQRVQGTNGSNAAQLSCPQGSTLTFQHKAGVSCGTGLRHGVTMHPRGRHLRGGMTLLSHGTYKATAREQQPITQPHNHNNCWRSWVTGVNRRQRLRLHRGCQDIGSKWHRQLKFPLREASRESFTTCSSHRDERCDSRLGPFKAQSNVVSQCSHGRLAKL